MANRVAATIGGNLLRDTTKRLEVGQFGNLTRVMSQDLVGAFAYVSGDDNPVHLDAEFAANTRFKKPIAHGMLYGAMISTIFGAQIDGAIYLTQQFHFKKPVFVGDSVTATVTVIDVKDSPYIVTCKTTVTNAETGEICTDGEAKVLLPEPSTERN